AALCVGLLVARSQPESYDARIMAQVAENLVDEHHPGIPPDQDEFGVNTPYATYGIGVSLLMIPPAAVGKWLGVSRRAAEMLVNPLLFGLLAGLIVGFGRMVGASWRQSGG